MRVLIDATPLLLRSAGVKNYLYHWLVHLRRIAAAGEIEAFPWLGETGGLTHERSVLGPLGTWPRLALLYLANVPGNPLLKWLASKTDAFHVTNQIRVAVRGTRVTATVHDMTATLMPELHTPGNVKADAAFNESVLKRAHSLIAVSRSTKDDAVRVLGIRPERIEVIHPGIADAYFEATPESAEATLRKYDLQKSYVLYVGTIEPRKNVETLLDAWGGLPSGLRQEYDLVLAGPLGWCKPSTRERLLDAAPGIRYLGYVPEPDMPDLFRRAAIFAYPSLYEGFGFPVAQAMAAGVPVLTSGVSSMPEVAGDAAVLVDPRSVGEIRSGLQRLLLSPSKREQLGARGVKRAGGFRWEDCAARSLAFFRRVVSS